LKNIIPEKENRPWGNFLILEDDLNFKVKKLEILPKQRLSYQRHFKRAEHWFIVSGSALVTLEGKEILLQKGDCIDIATEAAHRIENLDEEKNLIFVEIQTGEYFGEDDIVRLSDDYGR
jgi:mannose-6-phosphate isomerase